MIDLEENIAVLQLVNLKFICWNCGTRDTPQIRQIYNLKPLDFPLKRKLCNACGIRARKNLVCQRCDYIYTYKCEICPKCENKLH